MYYNIAARSFLSKKLCSRLHSIEVDFYSKKKGKVALFEPPFGRVRGNVRTSSIARWKARVRLPIRHNWTFFASSYCWDVTGGNLSTWAISQGGSLRSPIKGGRGRHPPTTVGWQKTRRIVLSCGVKINKRQFISRNMPKNMWQGLKIYYTPCPGKCATKFRL